MVWTVNRDGSSFCRSCSKRVMGKPAETCSSLEHREFYQKVCVVQLVKQKSRNQRLKSLLSEAACICCGKVGCQLDDIIPADYTYPRKGGSRAFSYYWSRPSVFQFLCRTCNLSKGNGLTCRVHNSYLGIWNYLPKLVDISP